MPIRVTCPGCHTRFNVSEKFAGREGPCPKCKASIRIPDKSQEVVIHAPADAIPKDHKGVALTKPIFRRETLITPVQWTLIIGIIAALLSLAVVIRFQVTDKANFPLWILVLGSIAVALPATFGGYGMLRDSELGGFIGRELWIRVGICAALYAALWLVMPVSAYTFNGYDTLAWSIGMTVMVALGGAVALSLLDFEYLTGILHYGMYLGCTLLLRWIMGIGVFPGSVSSSSSSSAKSAFHVLFEFVQRAI